MASTVIRIEDDERACLIGSLVLAAMEYADPSPQIALLERLGCTEAETIILAARGAEDEPPSAPTPDEGKGES